MKAMNHPIGECKLPTTGVMQGTWEKIVNMTSSKANGLRSRVEPCVSVAYSCFSPLDANDKTGCLRRNARNGRFGDDDSDDSGIHDDGQEGRRSRSLHKRSDSVSTVRRGSCSRNRRNSSLHVEDQNTFINFSSNNVPTSDEPQIRYEMPMTQALSTPNPRKKKKSRRRRSKSKYESPSASPKSPGTVHTVTPPPVKFTDNDYSPDFNKNNNIKKSSHNNQNNVKIRRKKANKATVRPEDLTGFLLRDCDSIASHYATDDSVTTASESMMSHSASSFY